MEKQYLHAVKKSAAIFLLSIYLLSAIQLDELLKINVLIAHFYETRQDDHHISFADFLVMHYITDDGNSRDNDRDCQLPFKSNSSVVANNFFTFILKRSEEIVMTPVPANKVDFHHYSTPFITSNFSKLVWNPPKIS